MRTNLQHVALWSSIGSGAHGADTPGRRPAALRSSAARGGRRSARCDALALRGGQEQARMVQGRRRGRRVCRLCRGNE